MTRGFAFTRFKHNVDIESLLQRNPKVLVGVRMLRLDRARHLGLLRRSNMGWSGHINLIDRGQEEPIGDHEVSFGSPKIFKDVLTGRGTRTQRREIGDV